MRSVSITKQSDNSEFYKFGGYDYTTSKPVDSFFVGKLQNGKADKPIIWKQADHFKLKKPLLGCGVIQRYPFIVIFGGETTGDKALDDIYILDIRSKSGWVQSPIKCPTKSRYVAVLDHEQKAHLFTWNNNKQHYSIALKDLVPELVNGQQRHDDDEKGGDEESESAKLRVCFHGQTAWR